MMGTGKVNESSRTWRIRKTIISGICMWLLIGIETASAQECSSATFNFNAASILIGSISATAVGTEIANYAVSNVESVSTSKLQGYNLYLNAELDTSGQSTRLVIKTLESFKDFLLTETMPELRAQLDFACSEGTRAIRIQVEIREENLHAPIFIPDVYNIQLPLPLPKEFDLTQFVNNGRGIIAYDYDLTGNEVDFAIEANAYFLVERVTGSSEKESIAKLRTTQTLTRLEELDLQITGTDRGNSPKSGVAQLKISGNPLIPYIETPRFEKSLYLSTYKRTEAFVPVEVVLNAGTFDDSVSFELSGDNVDLFDITGKTDHSGASVTLKTGAVIEETMSFLTVSVTASREGADLNGRTAIVVEVEPEVKILPAFEQPIYSGTVGQEGVITLAEEIKLIAGTIADGVQVTLEGEDAEFFELSRNAATVSLTASEKLTDEVLDVKFYFHVTVKATKAGIGSSVAIVVMEVLKEDVIVPKFEQLYYEGTLTEEGSATIPEIRIMAGTFVDGLVFMRAGEADLFRVSQDGNKLNLIPNGITEEKLREKFYLIEKISAVVDDQVAAETIVIIKIVRSEVITPKFETNLVEGQLTERNLQLTPLKVVVDSDTHNAATDVILKDSNNLLVLTQSSTTNEYTISLRSGVQLPSSTHITAFVEATNPKSATVSCFVLIEIIREPLIAPEFEETLYEGSINANGVLQELKIRLKPETYDDSVEFSLQDTDAELFQWNKLDNNDVHITLKESTSEDDLKNRNNLRFSVRAVKSTLETAVSVVVFIEAAEIQQPRFEKALYKSSIRPDLTLTPFETIQLEDGTGSEGLEVQILQSNSDLFTAQFNQDNRITISLRRALTSQDLEGFERFEFVIEVTNPGVGSASATIMIDIERSPIVVPEFTQVSYHGTLQEGSHEIIFTEKIVLKAGSITSGVVYTLLDDDASLVELSFNEDGSLKFTLKSEITVDQLKSKHQINFVVQAVNPGSTAASSSMVIQIIRPIRAVFIKSSYSGVLTEGQPLVELSDEIELLDGTMTDATDFKLVEGDSNLFQVSINSEKIIQISLRSNILWNQIRPHSYLTFKLFATNPGAESSSTTIIVNVVNLPIPTPAFTKTLYRGSLQKGVREVAFSAGEVITIQPETITSTFSYRIIDDDDAALFDITREENKFKASLKSTVGEEVIEGRDLLSFTIEVNNEFSKADRAVVIVNIQLDEIVTPAFSNALYRGSIKERTTAVSLPTVISFVSGTASSNTELGLVDGEADWFSAVYENSRVTIVVKSESAINWDEIMDRSFLSFALQATNPGSSAASAFVTLDIERNVVPTPRFKSSSFQGTLHEGSREVQFAEGATIELEDDSLLAGFEVKLTEHDHELFEFTQDRLQIKISLKTGVLGEDFRDRTYLRFNVVVNNPGGETATANVLVDLKWSETPANTPLFDKFFYRGTIGVDLQFKLEESIFIRQETYTPDVSYEIAESDSNLLTVEKDNREVVVKLAKVITEEDLKGHGSLHVTIRAINELGNESFCFLVISVIGEDGEPCTTPTIDCSECYDCSTGAPLEDVPVFEYGNYRFFIKSDTVGLIGTVKATVKDPSINLEHQAEISNEYINSRISFTADGILRINQPLLPGQYSFKVTALNPASQKQSSVNVLLDVTQDQECPADPESPKITTVEKLLVIKSLQEESAHPNIFPSELGSCEYEMIDEKPYLGYNYFEIDPDTHWLTAKAFDRENTTLFQGMTIPQFQVRLHLVCPEQTPAKSRRSARSLIETDDLNFSREVTVVQVIVTDINDHDPQFVVPPPIGGSFNIGFPVATIASGLMLSRLITVQAEDADEGLNAKIRYILGGVQSHFAVEAETGVIYPLKEAMKGSSVVTLMVKATDRDGSSDGRSAEVQLIVHRLGEDELVALTVPGQMDSEDMVRQINTNGEGIQLKVLTQARVPEIDGDTDDKTARQTSSEGSLLRMIVYAFDNANRVQSSDIIKRVIGSSSVSTNIRVDSFSNVACSECSGQHSEDDDNVGLIVATSVLGALFVISAGLAVFLYLRFVRPLSRSVENPSDVVQLENDFEVSPPPSPPMLGVGKQKAVDESDVEERKPSIQILGVTDQESEDTKTPSSRLAQSLEDRLERIGEYGTVSSRGTIEDTSSLSAVNEPRNVKFNEMVERIEVVEHHPDDQQHHRVDLEDDDSIYSERL
ncbi:uncharacterized protein LOC109426751 [Aedes albopictus]|uniref:Cadherin domain-containing protein n=1 Tax=Aedes albopictus TaxID=7160 RepID=A0ABM1Z0W7_AEDAL